jgi:hypothetical protein
MVVNEEQKQFDEKSARAGTKKLKRNRKNCKPASLQGRSGPMEKETAWFYKKKIL